MESSIVRVVQPLDRIGGEPDVALDRQPVQPAAERDAEQPALRRLVGEQERHIDQCAVEQDQCDR